MNLLLIVSSQRIPFQKIPMVVPLDLDPVEKISIEGSLVSASEYTMILKLEREV